MNPRHLLQLAGLSVASLLVCSAPTHAQTGPIVSLAYGSLKGKGGYWRETSHRTLDVLGGIRTNAGRAAGLIVAGYGGTTGTRVVDKASDCLMAPGGGCIRRFPQFRYLGAAIGGEVRSRYFGLVIAGGPGAFASPKTTVASPGPGATTQFTQVDGASHFGIMARTDFTFYLDEHFGVLAALSTRVIPNFGEKRLRISGLSLGLRVN